MTNSATGNLLDELAKLPPAVAEAYQAVADAMAESFSDEETALWAREGVAIGTQTVRSWESAVEYYRVSPEVARSLAVGALRDLPVPGLPHAGRGVLQSQPLHRH